MWGCGAVEMINLEAGDSCNLKFVTTDEFSSEQCNSLPSFLHYDDMLYICISQCTTAACIGRVLGIRRAWTACDILTSCRAPLINNAKRGPGTENSCTLNDENTHTSLSVHKALKLFVYRQFVWKQVRNNQEQTWSAWSPKTRYFLKNMLGDSTHAIHTGALSQSWCKDFYTRLHWR